MNAKPTGESDADHRKRLASATLVDEMKALEQQATVHAQKAGVNSQAIELEQQEIYKKANKTVKFINDYPSKEEMRSAISQSKNIEEIALRDDDDEMETDPKPKKLTRKLSHESSTSTQYDALDFNQDEPFPKEEAKNPEKFPNPNLCFVCRQTFGNETSLAPVGSPIYPCSCAKKAHRECIRASIIFNKTIKCNICKDYYTMKVLHPRDVLTRRENISIIMQVLAIIIATIVTAVIEAELFSDLAISQSNLQNGLFFFSQQ